MSSGQNGGGGLSLQRHMGHCWLADCGITDCVQSRHMERSWGAEVADLGPMDQNGWRSWAMFLPQGWSQELGNVLSPGTVSLLLHLC